MKLFFLFLVIFIISLQLQSQNNYKIPDEIKNYPLLNKQVSISGIACLNDSLYLVSERTPTIYVCHKDKLESMFKIKISGIDQKAQLEGLAYFSNRFYAVDEYHHCVYAIDIKKKEAEKITLNFIVPNISNAGTLNSSEDGLEGIAIDPTSNFFYLLQERDALKNYAIIYKCTLDNNKKILNKSSNTILPLKDTNWRYSDFTYDPLTKGFVCLKSRTGEYHIEYLSIDGNGLPQNRPALVLTESILKFEKIKVPNDDREFHSNLEGITMDKTGNLYLVSDNVDGKIANTEIPGKKRTMFFKMTKTFNRP